MADRVELSPDRAILAEVTVSELRVRTERQHVQAIKGSKVMAEDKLETTIGRMDQFLFGLGVRSDKLGEKIAQADIKADSVFAKANARVDERAAKLEEVSRRLDALEGVVTNGGPSLTESSTGSDEKSE